MKQDVIAKFNLAIQSAEDEAKSVFYDDSFADGVASVPAGGGVGISQADLELAVAEAKDAMQIDLDVVKQALADDEAALDAHVVLEAALHAKLDKIKALLDA